MKKTLKKILILLIKNDIVWFLVKPLVWIGRIISSARNQDREQQKFERNIKNNIFKNLIVQNGPFKGMIYPEINSTGSTIYPKLLGCYEKELWEIVEKIKTNKYTEIIDVGCAEGYYAIGLGINIPSAKVYAYDIDKKARSLCEKMAILNKVEERITIKSNCTPEELESFPFTGKGLIVCDCEGFEKKLFNKDNIKNLINCDLLIETHDLFDINISTYLKNLFSKTHNIYSIKSVDDIEKALTYNIKHTESFSLENKKLVFAEHRPSIVEWLIITPKL